MRGSEVLRDNYGARIARSRSMGRSTFCTTGTGIASAHMTRTMDSHATGMGSWSEGAICWQLCWNRGATNVGTKAATASSRISTKTGP
jgi:hypothetical protein